MANNTDRPDRSRPIPSRPRTSTPGGTTSDSPLIESADQAGTTDRPPAAVVGDQGAGQGVLADEARVADPGDALPPGADRPGQLVPPAPDLVAQLADLEQRLLTAQRRADEEAQRADAADRRAGDAADRAEDADRRVAQATRPDRWAPTRIVVPSLDEVKASGYRGAAAVEIVAQQVRRAQAYLDALGGKSKQPPPNPDTHRGRWRVLASKQVSLFGQITTINVGDVLDPQSYTADGIARLRQQGLQMEPIADTAV